MTYAVSDFVGKGLYSLPMASRLTKISRGRIKSWLKGYDRNLNSEKIHYNKLWESQIPEVDDTLAIGFLDLMEIRFVNAFKNEGLSIQFIRKCMEYASSTLNNEYPDLNIDHPFSSRAFKTDGKTIFLEWIANSGDENLLDLKSKQHSFKKVFQKSLYSGIEFSETGEAIKWKPAGPNNSVVIDPSRSFGQPVVELEGVPTATLKDAYNAEGSVLAVMKWFDVSKKSVNDALKFEELLDS